jgi:uncharacterized protein
MRIGVISDTHGLLRPEVVDALQGVEQIIHAGDVGKLEIVDRLQEIAPLTVVQGNVDRGELAAALSKTELLSINNVDIYILHDLNELDLDPAAARFRVVVSGHTHQPLQYERNGVWYLNPGSVGPKRFKLPVSMAYLHIAPNGEIQIEMKTLDV